MGKFAILILKAAKREIADLPGKVRVRVGAAIDGLAEDPRPNGVEPIQGLAGYYRVRVGDYRVLYSVADAVLVVTVTRVRHRREVYRGL